MKRVFLILFFTNAVQMQITGQYVMTHSSHSSHCKTQVAHMQFVHIANTCTRLNSFELNLLY